MILLEFSLGMNAVQCFVLFCGFFGGSVLQSNLNIYLQIDEKPLQIAACLLLCLHVVTGTVGLFLCM